MATKAPAQTPSTTKASSPNVPAVYTEDEFTAALRESGFLPTSAGGAEFNRLTVKGTNIVDSEDNIVAAYNQKTKEAALIVQLKGEPTQYQALWFDKQGQLAAVADRPDMNGGGFCKSHFEVPSEARRYSDKGTSCDECLLHPFIPAKDLPILPDGTRAKKCSWKADVEFRILEKQDDGSLVVVDPTVFTMSLSTTSIMEFVGSSSKKNNGMAGTVSPENTMVRIAKLGLQKWGKEGIQKAKSYLALGGVIAELHILPAKSEDGSKNWNVTSFNPIEILEVDEQPALTTAEATDDISTDALPF